MDYPLLNLLFGLGLIFTLVVNIGLRFLLSKLQPPVWLSALSWVALGISFVVALYIERLFLRLMTPAFNLQIGLGLLIIGGVGALVTAGLYPRVDSTRLISSLFAGQMVTFLLSLILAYGLYRSLVPSP